MSNLGIRRLIVVVISQALGFFTTYLIITAGFSALPAISSIETSQYRTPEEYGYMYFIVTAVPIGIVFMIWLDKYLDTRILPD